ncbi:MoaD/ThiS family protein [Azoarcus sp. L1K30]|uniref:MoaD/ThiS family protein n=1 Tax=Azoarcus sp. L1K30 TaxID=2820277 RepID=UPI001B843243|nr:MoaD/ThiS family protein [Azoarcus sp. L1K30]MBR0565736.1 MoaD/ThiS family protein [Azoarcus sp. L1K30]
MRVLIPSALRSYTGTDWVHATGDTVAAVLVDLERQYPGIRFRMIDEQGRIRRHIRLFRRQQMVFDLAARLEDGDELLIVQALSGG